MMNVRTNPAAKHSCIGTGPCASMSGRPPVTARWEKDMNILMRASLRFCHDTRGNSLFGYALLICLILGAMFFAFDQTGTGTWEPPQLITLPNWSPM